jgi:ADP-heptose:LPS heptosyltransferase
MGDSVLTTPAIDILKRFRPDLRVAVMVEDRFRAIFEGNPDVDQILPPKTGAVRRWRPQLSINFHGGNQSAWMTVVSGAKFRAGFGHFRHQFVYNVRIPRAQEILGVERTVHTAEHLASAMFYLGVPAGEIPRGKIVAPACSGQARRPVPLAVIHPVAANPQKTWRAEGFLAVAAHLQQSGFEPVFIGGPDDDLSAFREYRVVSGAPLSETKQLLSEASLFVGNDSGPAHIAAAFGLPVVVIFGASDPAIWRPWRTASEVVAGSGDIAGIADAKVLDALARLRVHA